MQLPLFIEQRGKGKQLLILGGGPGLAHDYLVQAFAPFEASRELLYVDYPGCGQSFSTCPVTSDAAIQLILETLEIACAGELDVICHSFGSYVLGSLLELCGRTGKRFAVGKCIFVCPSPHSRSTCRRADERLVERMSKSDLESAELILREGGSFSGDFMKHILPYYCGKTRHLPDIDIGFHPRTYLSMIESLGEFDLSESIAKIPSKLYIFGSQDFISPDMFIFENGQQVVVLDGGHFLFYDSRDFFIDLVQTFIG